MYYFDIAAMPPPPAGSDADRIAKGEIRAPEAAAQRRKRRKRQERPRMVVHAGPFRLRMRAQPYSSRIGRTTGGWTRQGDPSSRPAPG
jgi:hypothetical protein